MFLFLFFFCLSFLPLFENDCRLRTRRAPYTCARLHCTFRAGAPFLCLYVQLFDCMRLFFLFDLILLVLSPLLFLFAARFFLLHDYFNIVDSPRSLSRPINMEPCILRLPVATASRPVPSPVGALPSQVFLAALLVRSSAARFIK